ncbi:16S rRNA (adenine(1518)-N(6)/adenine(1519)-N(6))-dimethyltransferase RsmA [Erysipelothrix urinaevulpis]|uniref:16S rRNA (adenine(1518)-N(6)/adenine(1519)-N(6))- dimethyltransferase RsmA n=1 Tax=Erysipelothrix urinaevulpis TaxID=2683717 RepID=UPI0013584C47|nr:16S rRNA (adenine(1518)-N(6)/adenine(1519)-N(6))-dimethyltransferase RsmA [Erysipelothrix urinaevulpis]
MKTIANKNVSMDLLEKYERKAKKRFGQNFIIDPSVVERIAEHSGQGGLCLEIGPGLGSLTQQLAKRYDEVIAYEIDEHMVEILSESLEGYDNVQVLLEDFLQADLSYLEDKPLSVCANLPYYITTPILFKLMELKAKRITVMVQKEISDRLTAQPKTKDYSSLSIMMQYYFSIKTVMKVSRESFHPRPNVDSIIIQLTPLESTMPFNEKEFFEFVRKCFQFRRKTLVNNLKTIDKDIDYAKTLNKIGLDERVRADYLTLNDYLNLYGELYA